EWDPNADWWQATADTLNQTPALPATPTNIQIVSTAGAHISWTDNATNEAGFTIERAKVDANGVVGAFAPEGGTLASSGTGTVTWVDPRVLSGQRYVYRVRAFNLFGTSDVSAQTPTMDQSNNPIIYTRSATDVSEFE